jgi:hypothetical protein
MSNLEQVIADSVNDSINEVVEEAPEVEASAEAAPEPVEASESPSDNLPVEDPAPDLEVPAEVKGEAPKAAPEAPQDDFSKLVGMPQIGVGGRENRIPYSRVRKITEKAVVEAEGKVVEAVLGRKLNAGEKALDVVKSHVAQIPELQGKVTDYEGRLNSVAEFENVMANDPPQFLTMLARLPAYKEFFDFVDKALAAQNAPAQAAAVPPAVEQTDAMPEPDETLTDGSKVYSLEGLKKLLAWNAQQVESRVTKNYETKLTELDSRYKPMASAWEEQRRIDATLPVIRKQLDEAATWPLFKESEEEILNVLKNDKKISLEGAYRQVVFPKLLSERNKVRQEVIKEAQAAPTATSVAARTVTKPAEHADGPRSIEDIIKEKVAGIRNQ